MTSDSTGTMWFAVCVFGNAPNNSNQKVARQIEPSITVRLKLSLR